MGFKIGDNNWQPKVTCLTIQRFEEETEINLLEKIKDGIDDANKSKGGEVSMGLNIISGAFGGKFSHMMTAIFLSVEKQAVERNMDKNKFIEHLTGHEQVAFSEVGKAYRDFFQRTMGSLVAG